MRIRDQEVANWDLTYMTQFWRKIKVIWTKKKELKRESSWLEEPRCNIGSNIGSNSRIQFASNEPKLGPKNLDPEPPSKVGLTLFVRCGKQWWKPKYWVWDLGGATLGSHPASCDDVQIHYLISFDTLSCFLFNLWSILCFITLVGLD
jgi:hypothetical protein